MTQSTNQQSRSLGIGVDFGTSNSAAAIFDGEKIHLLKLESNSTVMPSATYIDDEYRIATGKEAIDQYIESNMGRTVELSAEVLGEARTTTGQIGDHGLPEEANTGKLYGKSLVDASQKGRLFRGTKRVLGNLNTPRLIVFNKPFRLVALITPLLLRIRKSIEKYLFHYQSRPDSIDHACIGHPINFEGSDPHRNERALGLLSEACRHAGFSKKCYYPEPIAAALSYLYDNPLVTYQTLLAVDFGGGTLDLCILKRNEKKISVIATHGTGLGGDHIDQLLFRKLIFPLLGKGERWRRAGEDREIETIFPFKDYEDLLLNWTVSYILNQNKYTSPIMQRIKYGDEAAPRFRRLYDLIKNNYSYLIFQNLKEMKATLSTLLEAKLDIPELDIELLVSREEFDQMINEILKKFQSAITELLVKAELRASDIQLVIRTGGSSLIPAVKNILDVEFAGKVIEHDPFTSVAIGLAIADYKKLGYAQFTENPYALVGSKLISA